MNGILARTKKSDVNEGGVSCGFAVIDCLYPVDQIDKTQLSNLVDDVLNE